MQVTFNWPGVIAINGFFIILVFKVIFKMIDNVAAYRMEPPGRTKMIRHMSNYNIIHVQAIQSSVGWERLSQLY